MPDADQIADPSEALAICRDDPCGCYEDEDRCVLLSRACQLPGALRRGWRCPHGFHRVSVDPTGKG